MLHQTSVFAWEALLTVLTSISLIPIGTFFLECIAALVGSGGQLPNRSSAAPTLAVLVPAHNEAAFIRATLNSLAGQVRSSDRLVVIADNCTDATASIARACGVTVVERFEPNPMLRGKGYALDFGLRAIAAEPPDVVVTVDGDCIVAPGAIAQIANQAHQTLRPVQATYLMHPPKHPTPRDDISALAVVVKNQVRPLGLSHLGLPNLLTGSGMAFPWRVIQQTCLAGSKTCDDMQTSIDLAIAGYPPTFCPQARITGRLMANQAAFNQRSRWEHGHLEMFTTQVPRLVLEAVRQRRVDLLALALEVAVPPLALLVMAWFGMAILATGTGFLTGSWLSAIGLAIGGIMLTAGVVGSWWKFGRAYLSPLQLLSIPFYALWKVPLYLGYVLKPQARWLKTERD